MTKPAKEPAVELAARIWWVGSNRQKQRIEANAYLIEQGDQSVLIDPGSVVTFPDTLRRIEQVIPFANIRWIVCQHQDPSVTSALPLIQAGLKRKDLEIVTHRLAAEMIRHYALSMPFWLVDEHQWRLPLADRLLQFVFTPYAHLPGAFCSFDSATGTLFSGDLCGGYRAGRALLAKQDEDLDSVRSFHEHFFPSREILNQALNRIENYSIEMIAPQHGQLLCASLTKKIMRELKGLECGLYLLAGKESDVQRLSLLNAMLRDITSTMVISRDFRDIADRLLAILQRALPAESLEFYVQLEDDTVLLLAPESRYRGVAATPPRRISRMFGVSRKQWRKQTKSCFDSVKYKRVPDAAESQHILLPLFKGGEEWMYGVAIISLREEIEVDQPISQMMEEMSPALQVALEREAIYRGIELERQKFYERSIRDPLTGLFTRFYMEDALRRLFEIHDRSGGTMVALAMLDIDHFKCVNDRYGHVRGDEVLCRVAQIIKADARAGDLPVRLGGEEFGLIVVGEPAVEIAAVGERLRQKIASTRFHGSFASLRVTISIGTALRQVGESIPGFIERADLALYQAKREGRNRVRSAESSGGPGQWTLLFE